MKSKILILLGILAVIGGLVGGALLGVLVMGLLFGIVGAALIGLIGWGAGKAARGRITHNDAAG